MPSPIAGVGVFAIRDIPAGINPVGNYEMTFERIPTSEIRNDPKIPAAVKKYIEDMCVTEKGYFYVPRCGVNNVHVDFYLNHSRKPNMKVDKDGESFVTIRKIKAGEELVIDYETYNDEIVL